MPRTKKFEEFKKVCFNIELKKYERLINLMETEGEKELSTYLNKLIDLLLE